ncbi:MAG: bacillithiol biosynthesis cysteine-adding enzyme BshC [Myxococcaceae bacterium]
MNAPFSVGWLRGDSAAVALLPAGFRDPAARAQAVQAASLRRASPKLLEVLVAQNATLVPSPARDRNLQLLGESGTTAIVTGQQVGLFLGPLYTIYKAASAIVNAKAITAETGKPCVPVFWLQTEDHDLPEIDHVYVPRAAGAPLKLELKHPDAGSCRSPVAKLRLGEGVNQAVAALRDVVGSYPSSSEHLDALCGAYQSNATLPDAFAQLLSWVFAEEGLVFFNPRDPKVAPLAAGLHRRVLDEAGPLSQTLAKAAKALTEAGFAQQVHIRPGSPLNFFTPGPDVDGPRYRLDPAGADRWTLVGHPANATVSTSQLHAALENEPLRFSTSALLRPVLQDMLLPSVAYVGGPGEIAYFGQLPPLYAALKLSMPLIVPRARFLVLDDRTLSILEKLGLKPDDLSHSQEALLAKLGAGSGYEAPERVQEQLLLGFQRELAALGAKMQQLDPGFAQAVERTEETVKGAVSRLVGKYGRAVGQRDQIAVERLERARGYVAPDGAPQERIHGMSYYACRFGTRAFVKLVLESTRPFNGDLVELKP